MCYTDDYRDKKRIVGKEKLMVNILQGGSGGEATTFGLEDNKPPLFR